MCGYSVTSKKNVKQGIRIFYTETVGQMNKFSGSGKVKGKDTNNFEFQECLNMSAKTNSEG